MYEKVDRIQGRKVDRIAELLGLREQRQGELVQQLFKEKEAGGRIRNEQVFKEKEAGGNIRNK